MASLLADRLHQLNVEAADLVCCGIPEFKRGERWIRAYTPWPSWSSPADVVKSNSEQANNKCGQQPPANRSFQQIVVWPMGHNVVKSACTHDERICRRTGAAVP